VDLESGSNRLSPLQIAATERSVYALKNLISAGARIDQRQSTSGMTALHYAILDGNSSGVEVLLGAGADPNLVTESGLSPLMLSAIVGRPSITMALLAAQADVNYRAPSSAKDTALHIAAARNEGAIAGLLLKAGADPLLTDAFNRTAARQASEHGNMFIVAQLEEAERRAEDAHFYKAYKKYRR
jgi:ankyrin repeat protein